MGNSQQVAALRKELEDLQREAEGRRTPGSVASMPLSEPADMSIGTPVMGASSLASPALSISGQTPAGTSREPATAPQVPDTAIPELKLDDKDFNDNESDGSGVLVNKPKSA